MKVHLGGLVAILVAVTVLFVSGYGDAATVVGYLGTFLWMIGMLLYVAIFDSKKRWPGEPFMQRLGSVLSFRRD